MEELRKYSNIINTLKQIYDKPHDPKYLSSKNIEYLINLYTSIIAFYGRVLNTLENSIEDDPIYKSQLIEVVKKEVEKVEELLKASKIELANAYLNNQIRLVIDQAMGEIPKEIEEMLPTFQNKESDNRQISNIDYLPLDSVDTQDAFIETFLEYFVISPVAYNMFCEYYSLIHDYEFTSDAISQFLNILIQYLNSNQTALALLENYIQSLLDRKIISTKMVTGNVRLNSSILQAKLSGQICEQIKKKEIVILLQESGKLDLVVDESKEVKVVH